jgi:hypothetical protein
MAADQAIHLRTRDRRVLVYRVAGALCGFALIIAGFATASWDNGWMQALFGLVTVGGALSYHLLTSVMRWPTCSSRVMNFRISADDAERKLFSCSRCGTSAYLTEGFYWQRDFGG